MNRTPQPKVATIEHARGKKVLGATKVAWQAGERFLSPCGNYHIVLCSHCNTVTWVGLEVAAFTCEACSELLAHACFHCGECHATIGDLHKEGCERQLQGAGRLFVTTDDCYPMVYNHELLDKVKR
jgi:hypothetical protein